MRDELDIIDISGTDSGAYERRNRNTAARRPVQKPVKRKDGQRRSSQRQNSHRQVGQGQNSQGRKTETYSRAALRQKRRKKIMMMKTLMLVFMFLMILLLCVAVYHLVRALGIGADPTETASFKERKERNEIIANNDTMRPEIIEDFLTVNEYSRPGEKLPEVKNIFVHYTANKGTSAAQNRSYFENLGVTGETSASAHFVIGFDGEIIQCIPLNEIAYAVKERNYDSVSIECCYLSEDGKFTDATYQSLIRLCGWLLKEYKLTPDDMRRHYDEGGKKCPLYYVEHEDAWEQFLVDLKDYIS